MTGLISLNGSKHRVPRRNLSTCLIDYHPYSIVTGFIRIYPVKSVCQRIRYTSNEALIFHQFCQTYCPDIHIRDIDPKYYGEGEGKELADRNGFRTVLEKGVRR